MAELPTDLTKVQPGLFIFSAMRERTKGTVTMDKMRSETDPLEKGIALFNEGRYFEAGAAWEVPWRATDENGEKRFLEGLIMVAGAFDHYLCRECAAAASLLEKGLPLVRSGINAHPDFRLTELAGALEFLRDEFDSCSLRVAPEALPKIEAAHIRC
jgi:predicted metal-dependent hydrolase